MRQAGDVLLVPPEEQAGTFRAALVARHRPEQHLSEPVRDGVGPGDAAAQPPAAERPAESRHGLVSG